MERVSPWERLRRINPFIWDGLLALAMFAAGLIALGIQVGDEPDLAAAALTAMAALPLVWRRRAPIVVLAVIAAAASAHALAGFPGEQSVPLAVGAYSAAAHRDRRRVLLLALPIAVAASVAIQIERGDVNNWVDLLLGLVLTVGLPMLLGRISFNRRRRIQRDLRRAASDAVVTERARIARELHDVVAHSMSVMVVQAGAARVVLEKDPGAAAAALLQIEDTGRTGLAEMRRLLGLLEEDGEAAARVPQPGLERLDELVGTMRGTGLPVEMMVEGDPRDLPRGVDLTAYRVVQEGLTNALKHAGSAHARVVLRYDDDAVEVEVADDGIGPASSGDETPGRGLIGMKERVALFGGSLETGPRPGGGFVVRARIPLGEPS